ncbi:hypothetical protein ABZP36_006936 [Zizania latifolia]
MALTPVLSIARAALAGRLPTQDTSRQRRRKKGCAMVTRNDNLNSMWTMPMEISSAAGQEGWGWRRDTSFTAVHPFSFLTDGQRLRAPSTRRQQASEHQRLHSAARSHRLPPVAL